MFATNRGSKTRLGPVGKRRRHFPSYRHITYLAKECGRNRLRRCLIEWIGALPVRKITLLSAIFCGCALAVSANAARTESLSFPPQTVFQKRADKAVVSEPSAPSPSHFVFKDRSGQTVSAPIVEQYQKDRIVHPIAKTDPRLDPRLSRAATIADERAHAHSKSRCWRYVKEALLASGAVTSYPKSSLAKEAGEELVRDYGFKKLPIRDPYAAPIGSVLVYFKGNNRAGHVELRTKTGFVSDFRSKSACTSALIGVYAKK
jgi:hypothetical protein